MTFQEKYNNASLDTLRDDLETLGRDIVILQKYWNDKTTSPLAVMGLNSDRVADWRFWKGLREITGGMPVAEKWEECRQFIHNFCTNLCAERIFVKDLLNRQAQA